MAYIGYNPAGYGSSGVSSVSDVFNGDNSTTVFTLSGSPVAAPAIFVFISGVKQATSTYTWNGSNGITFSTAPPTGTGNIEVIWFRAVSLVSVAITDGSVTASKLASDAVTTVKILDGNVTTSKIADANVTTAKIADANVTTAKIADGAITIAKLATTPNTANGLIQSDANNYYPPLDARRVLFDGAASQGDIVYYNGTKWTRLAAGTSGYNLQTQGAGANPTWAAGSSRPSANVAVFTSSGTFTVPTGVTAVKVTVVGAGGGAPATSVSNFTGPGGAGGSAIKWVTNLTPGGTVSVTVGQGVNGSSGGSSSFGAYCSATGGTAGSLTFVGGTGGIGSSGDVNIRGSDAISYWNGNPCGPAPYVMMGGSTPFAPGNLNAYANGYNYGGGSGYNGVGGGTKPAIAGGNGIVIVEW